MGGERSRARTIPSLCPFEAPIFCASLGCWLTLPDQITKSSEVLLNTQLLRVPMSVHL